MPPKLYLTGPSWYWKDKYKPNFREALAVSKDYKGTRKNEKPFHYKNLFYYIATSFDTTVANGCEADDLICIEQTSRLDKLDTIICTRDKDLRMCEGWHYGWECGLQPEFGPHYYNKLGEISLVKTKSGNKLVGGGKAFFFAQLLTGDTVDNIGGLDKTGPVKAYKLLNGATSEGEYYNIVKHAYQDYWGELWREKLQEQANLLWIAQGRKFDGSLVHYEICED